MNTHLLRPLSALLFAAALSPPLARAYVDVELEGNRHIVGDSYAVEGTKLMVYRSSGNVEVDRSAVLAIHERPGDAPTDVQRPVARSESAPAAAAPSSRSSDGGVEAAPSTHTTDPAAREEELGRSLMNLHLDRLAARQRGDDEALRKLDSEIGKLQTERKQNWKKLHPDAAGESAE